MTAFEIEEEMDVLSYVLNTLHTNISYLEAMPSNNEKYNFYIAQFSEMYANLESRLDDLECQLDRCTKEELQESNLEHLKHNILYKEKEIGE